MQKIKGILKVASGTCTWCDELGNNVTSPSFPIGANIALEIDLREAASPAYTDLLPAYPISELTADSFSIAIDGDYDHQTDPKMLLVSGIVVSEGAELPDGTNRTIITATIPNTNYAGLKAAVTTAESVELDAEIAGHKTDSVSSFVFSFPLLVRNRVWFPDDAPESVVNDPDYLNTAQVEAKIAADVATAVAAAIADLDGEDGTSNFVYIGYASDNAGADFSLTPSVSLPYVAIITSATALTPATASDFAAATWVKYLGSDGAAGTTTVTGLNLNPTGEWAAGTTYAEDDAVRHNGAVWQSLTDGNIGNEPSAESEYWQLWVQDGADGNDGSTAIYAFNTVSDPASLLWHTTLAADDVYFRISTDDGITWSVAHELSKAQTVIVQYNPDATTNWQTATKPSGAAYSTATGKYFRVSFTGGVYGEAAAILAGMESQELRIQFSSTGITENEADWHAEPATGDTYIRFFNSTGTVQVKFTIDLGGLEIVSVQLSPTINPWHTTYAAGDYYMRVSVDGGGTFSTPIKVVGTDASEPQTEFSVNGVDWTTSPTNAVYQRWSTDGGTTWTAAVKVRGDNGAGLEIGAIGLLADRGDYDAAAVGFIYLATDIQTDDDGRPYNLLYQRSSSTQGEWSDGAIAYIGPRGIQGPASTVPGPRGADATIIADLEFAAGDMVEDIEHGGALTIPGVKAIAQVEIYDANGDGISIERGDAAENGKCLIKTKYADNETIVYFGTINVTNGGRIKFAQGNEANSILLGSNSDLFMDILKLRLRRPYITSNLHLLIQSAVSKDFSDAATLIDTANTAADRAVVEGYDPVSGEFVICPETGFSADYQGQSILIGMAGLASPRYIRYKWVYADGETDYYTTFFPSSGESFASEIPVDTTGSLLKVSTVNAVGEWSIDAGATWKASGETANLAPGTYTVSFSDESGFLTPGDISITLTAGDSKNLYGYYLDAAGGAGTITVNITGPAAARWSIDGINWYASGVTLDVLAGDYIIQYLPVDLYLTPATATNTVADTDADIITATYYAVESPAAYGMSWANGTEPTVEAPAVIRYCTPTGAGSKDGSSWANAYAGIYRAGLGLAANDVLYLWEGEYSLLAPLSTSYLQIFGGFNGAGTWATRDGFAHQTIINGKTFVFSSPDGPITLDGIVFSGFSSAVTAMHTNLSSDITLRNCAFIDCNAGSANLLGGASGTFANNLLSGCETTGYIIDGDTALSSVGITDCVFVDTAGKFRTVTADDSKFFRGTIILDTVTVNDTEFTGVVIESTTGTAYTGCSMSNCEITDAGATATACKFINCKATGGGYALLGRICTTAVNCLFENCTAIATLCATSATYCTAIRCNKPIAPTVINCAAWGDYGVGGATARTTCAQSDYVDAQTVVLGDDNSLAEFTDTGAIAATGYISPAPDSGDWGNYAIGATSVLKGAGTHNAEITTDITGAARANPPSIGCYE